jgi:hypothetical protein
LRYEEFRDIWTVMLERHGLLIHQPSETIDLTTTGRHWEGYTGHSLPQRAEPFHITAMLEYRWDPLENARSFTCEEDLLTELVGRKHRPTATQPRLIRVDFTLNATLEYGKTVPLPPPEIWGPWTDSLAEKFEKLLPISGGGRKAVVVSWRGELEIQARAALDGTLALSGMSIPAFEMVRLPRVWDDPARREKERDAGAQLDRLARRFRSALDVWMSSVAELGRWNSLAADAARPRGRTRGVSSRSDDEPQRTH